MDSSLTIHTATVIGAGAMGSGIAQVLAQAGVRVFLYDTKDEALDRAMAKLGSTMDRLVEKGRMTTEEREGILGRIQPILYLREAADSDLVIEAIFESLEAKRSVFTLIDDVVRPDCILATMFDSTRARFGLNRAPTAAMGPGSSSNFPPRS